MTRTPRRQFSSRRRARRDRTDRRATQCVALLDSAMKHEGVPMRVTLGIVLTGVALEQYNLS